MINRRMLIGFVLSLILIVLQAGAVRAAPLAAAVPDGTVVSVTQSTDASGGTTFVVVVKDSQGVNQTASLTPTEAEQAGLVTANADGTYTINATAGATISGGQLQQGSGQNPCESSEKGIVAAALSAFFCQGDSAVLNTTVDALHAEGFGFGEIAQACFMAEALGSTCGDILTAKSSHDFAALGLPDNVTNWGQLKKYTFAQEVKSLTNLGSIMSGRATAPATGPTPVGPANPLNPNAGGNGHGNGPGNGNGNGNGNGHGHKP